MQSLTFVQNDSEKVLVLVGRIPPFLPTPNPTPGSSATPIATPIASPFQTPPSNNYVPYQCPIHPSNNCQDASQCQSSCVGQFSNNATCTYYGMGGLKGNAGVKVNCPALTVAPSAAYFCNATSSNGCDSASACQSTCIGQLEPSQGSPVSPPAQANACITYGQNGNPYSYPSCNAVTGSLQLYSCPTILSGSNGTGDCSSMSVCQSTCLGQITTLPKCYYYGTGGATQGNIYSVACTLLGTQTF